MKNLILTCTIVLFAICTTVASTNDYTYSVSASLRDGSVLKGKLLTGSIEGATIFNASMKLSTHFVKLLSFSGTNGEAKVTLANGDILSMTVANKEFEIDSAIGKVSIAKEKLCDLAISVHQIAKPNGKADGDYCVIDISGRPNATAFPVVYYDAMPEGDQFKTTSIVLKKIPAGSFMMCNQANVTISKPFFIGVYEVTRRQLQLVSPNDTWQKRWWKSGADPDHPVNFITYNAIRGTNLGAQWPASDAVDPGTIIDVLRNKTGLKFDLPTEAQWEYACRAGTTSLYNNGGDSEIDLQKLGRYRGTGRGLAPVGSYQPNNWGLYDMHGNVFEWCLDWGPWPLTDSTDPVGLPNGRCRCLRGGCVDYRAGECTSDFRYYGYGYPSNESAFFGFRLACPAK